MDDGKKKEKTVYVKRAKGMVALGAVMALNHLPSLALSGQRLGGASLTDKPYLVGGKWNVVDLSESYGHAIIHGFVNRLILHNAPGIFVRLFGTFNHIDARNIGCSANGHHSWIEMNGDIFELDLRGNAANRLELIRGVGGTGGPTSFIRALEGKEKINPLSIEYVISDDPDAWRKALAATDLNVQSNLVPFCKRIKKE